MRRLGGAPHTGEPAGHGQAVGTVLRRYRLAAGLTQEELAARAGISRRSICDLERGGAHTPRTDTLNLLADALGLCSQERALLLSARRPALQVLAAAPEVRVPPLVGRADDLAWLASHLAGAGSPAHLGPPVLLLAGEPGIGKTRLLQAVGTHAVGLGLRVLEGGCGRRSHHVPYAPILGALHRHLTTLTAGQQHRELCGCAWLVRLLPELAGQGIEPLPPWSVAPEHERRLMFDAVIQFLRNASGPAGTVLLLDDLQWAGADALDLLATLARAASVLPLWIVGAYRDTEVGRADPLSSTLAALAQSGLAARRAIGPLALEEARRVLEGVLDGPGEAMSRQRDQVLRRAGGVPFFLLSLAQAARQAAQDDTGEATLPWDVEQSVRQRVAALPEQARALLGVAAVVGRVVPRALLARIALHAEDELLDAVDAACQARLLEEHGANAYRFTHDVIREVVEQDLGAARCAVMHRRVAAVLEGTAGELQLGRLAFHYVQGDVPDKAALYLEKAGDVSRSRYANRAAEDAYREAAEYLERLGRVREAARVREKWGAVLRILGRHAAAGVAFERAIDTYQAAGDLESVARTLAETWLLYSECGASAEGVRRYQSVVDLLAPHGPSPGLAALYAALAILLAIGDRYDEQLMIADRAVEVARGAGDGEVLAEAIIKRGHALVNMVGRVAEGIHVIEEVIRLGEDAGGMTNLAGWYNILARTYLSRGEVATCQRLVARGREIAERQGNLLRLVFNTVIRAHVDVFMGNWEQAQADYAWAADTSRQIEASRPFLEALNGLGSLAVARGEWATATSTLEEAVTVATRSNNVSALRAASLLLAERDILVNQPLEASGRLVALRERSDPHERYVDDLPIWLAWAKAELGQFAEASRLLTPAIECIRSDSRRLALTGALYVQALVAIKQQQWAEGERVLDEGTLVAHSIGYPYAEARLLHMYGSLRLYTRDYAKAREQLEAALALFERLGARWEVARVEQALTMLQSAAGNAERAEPVVPSRNP